MTRPRVLAGAARGAWAESFAGAGAGGWATFTTGDPRPEVPSSGPPDRILRRAAGIEWSAASPGPVPLAAPALVDEGEPPMKIGILTSGGDCPGLNAVIRGAVLKGDQQFEDEFIGYRDGWRGVIDDDWMTLPRRRVRGIGRIGGTILGTSRSNPFADGEDGAEIVRRQMEDNDIDGIIAIGGDGTLFTANRLFESGIPVIGVPKTVDNDLDATDYTFGFNTAVEI